MARRCTTVPGFGACCRAAQAGQLNQAIPIPTPHGQRCGVCTVVRKRNGSPGFRFHFRKSAECGIGPGGCPALAGSAPQLPLPMGPQSFF